MPRPGNKQDHPHPHKCDSCQMGKKNGGSCIVENNFAGLRRRSYNEGGIQFDIENDNRISHCKACYKLKENADPVLQLERYLVMAAEDKITKKKV